MGSVLSFPFLCAANLIAYYRAVVRRCEELGIDIPEPSELSLLINGDDILFISDTPFYNIWKEEIGKLGFTLSDGKNLCHPQYFTINSTLFKTSVLKGFKSKER